MTFVCVRVCVYVWNLIPKHSQTQNVFSLSWPATILECSNSRKCSNKNGATGCRIKFHRIHLGHQYIRTFQCFGTPIYPPLRQMKTLFIIYRYSNCIADRKHRWTEFNKNLRNKPKGDNPISKAKEEKNRMQIAQVG